MLKRAQTIWQEFTFNIFSNQAIIQRSLDYQNSEYIWHKILVEKKM